MEPARSIAVASRFTLSKPSGANALRGGEPNFCLYASLNSFMPGVDAEEEVRGEDNVLDPVALRGFHYCFVIPVLFNGQQPEQPRPG
jgi:hypothetical protein